MNKHLDRGILSRYDFRKMSTRIGYTIMIICIVAMLFTMLYPIFETIMNGLKTNKEINTFPPKLLPDQLSWGNFKEGWAFLNLPLFFRNTLFIFVGNMVVTVLVLGLASFSLSRLNVPYKNAILLFFMMALFIPPTTYIIPNFLNLKDFGLLNTFQAFWLPAGANAFFLLLLKTFFDDIHQEMFEAARIDGSSDWRCFYQIALPLSVPIFATLGIFVFANAWNDWFWPSLVMHGDNRYPLATAIYKYVIAARGLKLNIKFAILTMVMIPPIIVFMFFQRYIMRGLHLGGIKG